MKLENLVWCEMEWNPEKQCIEEVEYTMSFWDNVLCLGCIILFSATWISGLILATIYAP
jgi:hypothetical protein